MVGRVVGDGVVGVVRVGEGGQVPRILRQLEGWAGQGGEGVQCMGHGGAAVSQSSGGRGGGGGGVSRRCWLCLLVGVRVCPSVFLSCRRYQSLKNENKCD